MLTIEDEYNKLSDLEHALLRPDTYIGEVQKVEVEDWVLNDDVDALRMEKRTLEFSPAAVKVFDEIAINARDQAEKNPSVTMIKITADKESGLITIENNGVGVPVVKHKDHDEWVPQICFGDFKGGSNFNDDIQRTWGGKNGIGAKATNAFSTLFEIETRDLQNNKKYVQTWTDNMSTMTEPKITKFTNKSKAGTSVKFVLDWKRFHMECLEDDFFKMIERRAYDIAACTRDSVNVYWNNKRISIKTFEKYVEMFIGKKSEKKRVFCTLENQLKTGVAEGMKWDVAVCLGENGFEHQSYVNGLYTREGGSHVDYIRDKITRKVAKILREKSKKTIKTTYIREQLFIFVNATVVNPSFNSQTKDQLTTKPSNFKFKGTLDDKFVEDLTKKCGLGSVVLQFADFREKVDLSKADGSKTRKVQGIPNFEDANCAGTKESHKCTLIITEGLSAKTYAISGMSVVGRDYYGVFPLKGKLLNVRNATNAQLAKNKECVFLMKILGLQLDPTGKGKVYRNVKDLRYGRVMLMTDQDPDGAHIRGLFMNYIEDKWPSLLQIPGFICAFETPLIKATKGKGNSAQRKDFYSNQSFNEWKTQMGQTEVNRWNFEYLKGLGSSDAKDAKLYFSEKEKYIVSYYSESPNTTKRLFNKAFNNGTQYKEMRKKWLTVEYDHNNMLDKTANEISYENFINQELVHYFHYDCSRSVGNLTDGWKTSQRKVFFACRKRNVNKFMKVFQLGGAVAEESDYHHGDTSLNGTIVGMGQTYTGSNNLNPLEPSGQFGSRVMNGSDSSAARYISARLNQLTDLLFPKVDDVLVDYRTDDDGHPVEPICYVPIIPMVLVNGCDGIGTGFSTTVPCYNPLHIIDNIFRLLRNETLEEMVPWYQDFKGTIVRIGKNAFESRGCYTRIDDTTIRVTELPVGDSKSKSFKAYLEFLEGIVINSREKDTKIRKKQFIKSLKNNYSDDYCDFLITFPSKAALDKLIDNGTIEKKLNLISSLKTTNLYLFNENDLITKYDNTLDILKTFCKVRLLFYGKRKDHQLQELEFEITKFKARIRFLELIMSQEIKVFKVPKEIVEASLDEHADVPRISTSSTSTTTQGNYDYLLSMPISRFTQQEMDRLQGKLAETEQTYQILFAKEPADLWVEELNALTIAITKHQQAQTADRSKITETKGKSKRKRTGAKNSTKGPTKKKIL